jgi:hypothetical protein
VESLITDLVLRNQAESDHGPSLTVRSDMLPGLVVNRILVHQKLLDSAPLWLPHSKLNLTMYSDKLGKYVVGYTIWTRNPEVTLRALWNSISDIQHKIF